MFVLSSCTCFMREGEREGANKEQGYAALELVPQPPQHPRRLRAILLLPRLSRAAEHRIEVPRPQGCTRIAFYGDNRRDLNDKYDSTKHSWFFSQFCIFSVNSAIYWAL